MLGLFGLFGRSLELQRLDDALRAVGLHPAKVSEAVKLTVLKQLKEASGGRSPELKAYAEASQLLAYCVLGLEEFTKFNGVAQTDKAERRVTDALETGYGAAARLVLLTLHAHVTHQSVVDRFDLASE